jgi:sec-independent protein translocase protein TatB
LGTSELILIGIIALMFLGPRKLPGMARKAGKLMAEFRGTASEFKETWQREVNFEEEAKLLNVKDLEAEAEDLPSAAPPTPAKADISAPEIKQVDASQFTDLIDAGKKEAFVKAPDIANADDIQNDKKNWL